MEINQKLFCNETKNTFHLSHESSSIIYDFKKKRTCNFVIRSLWYWITITFAIVTVLVVLIIPENTYPTDYVRIILGAVYVMFLPGFALTKLLFPSEVPVILSSKHLDLLERFALSVGLSLILTPLVGLLLNYTSWGIRLVPITLSLLALTLILATLALLNQNRMKYIE